MVSTGDVDPLGELRLAEPQALANIAREFGRILHRFCLIGGRLLGNVSFRRGVHARGINAPEFSVAGTADQSSRVLFS